MVITSGITMPVKITCTCVCEGAGWALIVCEITWMTPFGGRYHFSPVILNLSSFSRLFRKRNWARKNEGCYEFGEFCTLESRQPLEMHNRPKGLSL